jgi:DNA-binding CsgD family transcriptional regulator
MSERCEACGQTLPSPHASDLRLTDQELNVLSAWWLLQSIRATARFFGRSEQTVKNQLLSARRRNGIRTTPELAMTFMAQLRTMEQLRGLHNVPRRKAA